MVGTADPAAGPRRARSGNRSMPFARLLAVLGDGERRLRYRGRIDDQYRLGGARPEPTKRELKDALDAVLTGKPVAVAVTQVDGCAITFPQPRKPRAVTFAEHVAPILKTH